MRGPVHEELRVLGPAVSFEGREQCPRSGLVNRTLVTPGGIGLGTTRADAEGRVGRPTISGRGWFERHCSSRQPMSAEERARLKAPASDAFWDVGTWFMGVEADGRLVAFGVGRYDTY